jgi:hypothetical protein
MSLAGSEADEIRRFIHAEMAEIEREARDPIHGSYGFLCASNGLTFYSHQPVGKVLRKIGF